MKLPGELVIEILARLPAKQVRLCKCVSKPWRAIIASRPFQAAYRSRQGCVMLCWSDEMHFFLSGIDSGYKRLFSFSYSPLKRLQDSTQDFTQFPKRPVHGFQARVTQLVNGLLCIGETDGRLTSRVHGLILYNVCTGESMRIPEPKQYSAIHSSTASTFHLGYDHVSRKYKLLRLVFKVCGHTIELKNFPPRVHIMTLQGPDSVSTWRKLEPDEAGVHEWMKLKCSVSAPEHPAVPIPRINRSMSEMQGLEEARTFPGDGVLCWYRRLGGLVLFDLNEERFRWFKLPEDIKDGKQQLVPRAQFSQERLTLSLWVLPKNGEQFQPQCFVMEDDEGNRWSEHSVDFPGEFETCTLGVSVSNGEMLLVNPNIQENCSESSRAVYCYDRHGNKQVEKFWVGKLPDKKRLGLGEFTCFGWDASYHNTIARLSCLLDANHLYLPLHDVLSG